MTHWTEIAGQLAMSEKFKIRLPHLRMKEACVFRLSLLCLSYNPPYTWRARVGDMGANLKECTLTARSVNDMTQEEKQKRKELMDLVTMVNHDGDEWRIVDEADTVKSFLYLISIGVLPPNVSTEGVEFITPNGE